MRPLVPLIEEYIRTFPLITQDGDTALRIGIVALDQHPLWIFLRFLEALALEDPDVDAICPPILRSYQNFLFSFLLPKHTTPALQELQKFCTFLHQAGETAINYANHIVINENERLGARILHYKPRRPA